MNKIKDLYMLPLIIFIFFINIPLITASANTTQESLEKIKNSIVTINTRIAISAYQDSGSWDGTGFIVDKKRGLILTNNHIIGKAGIGNYLITFYNGRQAEAKLIYYDSWQDFAFLKVDINEIPESSTQIIFSNNKPKLNQKVFIIGNNEGREFSFHDGYISSLYAIDGEMPQASYIINLNSAGGSSGSPLISESNEAIGIIYGGSKTYSLALHGDYVKAALKQIQNDDIPIRKHIGIFVELYSLDKAVKHKFFPKKLMEEYVVKFPDSRNKVIAVNKIIVGSPAEKLLRPGDIIWAVRNLQLGADLAMLDQLMDNTSEDKIQLIIYREGEKIEMQVPIYNVNDNKIEKMIEFAGATFFLSDDSFSVKTGIPLKTLAIKNVQTGSPFSLIPVSFQQDYKNMYRLAIYGINKYQLNNLEDLEKIIPIITAQKYLNVKFKNYQPYYPWFSYADNSFTSAQEELQIDIELDNIDTMPRKLKFDQKSREWSAENIK